jgi:rhamnogalacturonyl hydrolase YesR
MILNDGTIRNYKISDLNIDNIRPGKFVVRANEIWKEGKNQKAVETLMEQLGRMPRTEDGIWWHKKIYPHQVWLDGLYMGIPFYTLTATKQQTRKQSEKVIDDAISQIMKTATLTLDSKTGLYRHAYDASHSIFWADKTTGQSAHTWGRAQGWMMMAITELLDVMPPTHTRYKEVVELLQNVAAAVARFQDSETGLWQQVMDVDDERNYLEATCSCMFAYSLLKGVRIGWLPESFSINGTKAYKGIINNFLHINSDKTISLSDCCSVAGLGPESNTRRDGSFEYYISEPIRDNDPKGLAPFIWASIEMEMKGYTASSLNTE